MIQYNVYRGGGLLLLHLGGCSWRWWDTYDRKWQRSLWDETYPPRNVVLIAKNVVFK